jgi:hypothetical protein
MGSGIRIAQSCRLTYGQTKRFRTTTSRLWCGSNYALTDGQGASSEAVDHSQ